MKPLDEFEQKVLFIIGMFKKPLINDLSGIIMRIGGPQLRLGGSIRE